jgi:hypothetical protein
MDGTLPTLQSEASVTVVHVRGTTKVAVTVAGAVIATVQGSMPVQPPPDHPANVEPAPVGLAVRSTLESRGKGAEQVAPQSMPAGSEATVPSPFPTLLRLTVSLGAKVAVTDFAAVIATSQGLVSPVQSPDHPVKIQPLSGVAVRAT